MNKVYYCTLHVKNTKKNGTMEKGKVEFQDKGIIRTLMNKGILMKGLCLKCIGLLLYIEVRTFPDFVFNIS